MTPRFKIKRPPAAPRAYEFDPPTRDAGASMVSGVFNSTMAQIVKVFCQIASVLVLSRMLTPADFGLIAMASPVYGFVYLFQDLGLGLATVQRPNLTHAQVTFFFWLNLAIGGALALVMVMISPLVARYYAAPELGPLVAAMALLLLISAAGVQSGAILMRRMQFRALAINGALGALAGLVAAVIAASFLQNHWALYFGMLVGTALPALGAVIIAGWAPGRPAIPEGARSMLQFGGGVTVSNVSHFLARNVDNVLIGWRWGETDLGLYDRAYKLLLFPLQFIAGPTMYAMAPVLSRLDKAPDEYRRIFTTAVTLLLLAIWPGVIWAMVFSAELVPLLLGQRWSGVSAIFSALALAGLLQVLNGAPIPLFVSQGRTNELAKWGLFHAATCLAAFVIGLPFGVVGVAIAYAVSECVRTPLIWLYATRRGPVSFGHVIRSIAPYAAGAAAAAASLLALRIAAPPLHGLVLLSLALVVAYATSLALVMTTTSGRATLGLGLRFGLDLVKRKASQKSG